jgi:hypothetical protein
MLLTGWLFALFNVFVLAMLALDIGLLRRTPRAIAAKEAALWAGLWGCFALAFCRILWIWKARFRPRPFWPATCWSSRSVSTTSSSSA